VPLIDSVCYKPTHLSLDLVRSLKLMLGLDEAFFSEFGGVAYGVSSLVWLATF